MKKLIHGIFLIINIVAIICVLMTYIGGHVSPEKFLLPAFFALFFPVTVIVNIIFILFWLILKRWYFLLSLAAITLSFSLIKATFPIHATPTEEFSSTDHFTLMTYNSAMLGGYKKHTEENPNKVIQHILDSDPDIICIQEFATVSGSKYITHQEVLNIFKAYPYKHIYYKNNKSVKSGIATFSKYPMIKKETIDLNSQSNGAIYSDIVIRKDTIRLFNCHLESNKLTGQDKAMPLELRQKFDTENLSNITLHLSRKLGQAYRIRARQADIIHNEIQSSQHKVMVCGDFNDVPLSYSYTKIKGNLEDAFGEAGTGLGTTFNETVYRFRIDYILYDEIFSLQEIQRDKIEYSDHYPLKATFSKGSN